MFKSLRQQELSTFSLQQGSINSSSIEYCTIYYCRIQKGIKSCRIRCQQTRLYLKLKFYLSKRLKECVI